MVFIKTKITTTWLQPVEYLDQVYQVNYTLKGWNEWYAFHVVFCSHGPLVQWLHKRWPTASVGCRCLSFVTPFSRLSSDSRLFFGYVISKYRSLWKLFKWVKRSFGVTTRAINVKTKFTAITQKVLIRSFWNFVCLL